MAEGNVQNNNILFLYPDITVSSLSDMKTKLTEFVGKFSDNTFIPFRMVNSFYDTVYTSKGTGTYLLFKINNSYWWGYGTLGGGIYIFSRSPESFKLYRIDNDASEDTPV